MNEIPTQLEEDFEPIETSGSGSGYGDGSGPYWTEGSGNEDNTG